MVKSVVYTITAITLCFGFFFWTESYLDRQFAEVHGALDTLYDKVEEKTATREDAYAVKQMWEDKKSKLHVFIPHNDISYVDYWLNETCGLIYEGNFELALGKVEVLLAITSALPSAYSVKLENVF